MATKSQFKAYMITTKYKVLTFAVLLTMISVGNAFKVHYEDFLNVPIHEDITAKAIGKKLIRLANKREITFDLDALAYVKEANTESDEHHFDAPDFHFDEDSFAKSTSNLVAWKKEAAEAAIKGTIRSNFTNVLGIAPGALDWLGRSLHLIQDFYAHSSWVNIHEVNAKLRHPRFGQADALNQIALDDAGVQRADLNESVAACDAASYMAASDLLTTGYYDAGMSLADVNLAFQSSFILTFPHITRYSLLIADENQRAGLGFYTKQWKTMIESQWPESRCVHGGDTGPGLNKDKPGRSGHEKAYEAAITGSAMFLDEVIAEIRKTGGKDADRAVCALLEHKTLSDCDMPTEVGSVDFLNADSATAFVGAPVRFVVIGSNIPGSAVVRMENATCTLNSVQTSSGFTAICIPYKPGSSTVEVIGAFGDTPLKSITYNIESADLQIYPSIREIYQKISFALSNVYLTAKIAWWRISDTLNKKLLDEPFDVKATVTQVFEKVGKWTIEVFFLDAASKPLGLGVSKDIEVVDSSIVSGTANVTSVKTASGVDIPEAGSTSEQRPKLSGTLSAPISSYFSVWVYLDGARYAQATTDGTSWNYTPSTDIPVGAHQFAVAVLRFDGIEGAKSAPRSFTVIDLNGLVGYWSFNDCTAADNSGTGNNGTLVGSPACVTGRIGNGMRLNSNNWIEVPDNASLDFSGNFTISIWFNADALTSTQSTRLVDKITAGYGDGYLFAAVSTGIGLITMSNPINVSIGVFHHAVVTFKNGLVTFFLDGRNIGQSTVSVAAVPTNDRPLRIGASQGSLAKPADNFVGIVDEVRLYNVALPESDVIALFNATPPN